MTILYILYTIIYEEEHMAGLSNDYIQQQLLDQSVSMNDNLSAMREILLDVKKNTGKKNGSGGGGGNNNGNGSGNNGGNRGNRRNNGNNNRNSGGGGSSFKNAFKDLFGEASNLGRTALGNNGNIQNVVGSVGTSAKILQRSLGALPGPIGLVASGFMQIVQVGAMVYEYLNQQLQMYNQLNSAGVTLANGMLTVRKGSGAAFMSINEFSQAVTKNSDSLAAMEGMYGDGVEHFGKLLNTVQLTQEQMGLYGVSQQQLADITAKNFKFEKMYASQQTMRNMNESQSTTKFVGSMTYLSKAVGKSVDELLSRFNDLSTNIDTGATISALQNQAGFTEKKSVEVMKTWNSMFASMGEFGKTSQQLNASKWSLGSLPEEFNDEVSQQFAQFMQGVQKSGITDQRTINKMTANFIKEHQDMISKQADIDRAVGNTAAENFHRQMLQTMNLLNDPKNNPSPVIEEFTNRFNLWLGNTFTQPFNEFYTKFAEKATSYLMNLADNSTDGWDFMSKLATDAIAKFQTGMSGPFGMLASIPSKLMGMIFGDSWNKVSEAFGNLAGDLIQIPIRVGKLIWEMFTGSDADVDAAGKELAGSIKHIFSDVTAVFNKISKLSINFDDVKTKFQDAINSLKSKFSSMLGRIKSWWNDSDDEDVKTDGKTASNDAKPISPTASQPKTAGVQKVTAPPEYTPPAKVEQADQSDTENVQTAKNASNEQASKLLGEILNNLEQQGQNNGQIAVLLRQIAENTEPPRNV
jgi:hypothetical protein